MESAGAAVQQRRHTADRAARRLGGGLVAQNDRAAVATTQNLRAAMERPCPAGPVARSRPSGLPPARLCVGPRALGAIDRARLEAQPAILRRPNPGLGFHPSPAAATVF